MIRSHGIACVDANLVVRLLGNQPDASVVNLWSQWREIRTHLIAPSLLHYEVVNALRQYERSGELSPNAVDAALHAIEALKIELFDDDALHRDALAVARRFNLGSAYDAHFLALAERLSVEFWTADAKLVHSLKGALPWVHLVT